MHHPLQQGLRHAKAILRRKIISVQVHHPLQQGLRLFLPFFFIVIFIVQVHHPLQQGLRLRDVYHFIGIRSSTSASSITTRIKTTSTIAQSLSPA